MKINYFVFLLVLVLFAACDKSKKTTQSLGSIDESQVVNDDSTPKINVGEYKKFTLDNGLQVILIENQNSPLVSYQLHLDIDPVLEGNKAGISELAGSLLKSGTATKSKSEIDEVIDSIGGSFSTDSEVIFVSALKIHNEVLLSLFSEILLTPLFPKDEVEKEKLALISKLAAGQTDPIVISSRVSNVINFGKNHPYGEFQTGESINNITQEDLFNYHETFFRPNVSYLIISGDISETEAKISIEKHFGKWKFQEVPQYYNALPKPPMSNRIVVVPVEDAAESIITITYPIVLRPGAEDNAAAYVMNRIFCSDSSSRLRQNICTKKKYTEYASSKLIADKSVGEFSVSTHVRNEVLDSTLTQMYFEMEQMISNAITDSVLQIVKNYWQEKITLALAEPENYGHFALNIEKNNLPRNYYTSFLTQLEKLTKEDILGAAKKYILPENNNVIIVGNKNELTDRLKAFSPNNTIEFLDVYGNPWLGKKDIPEGITIETIFNRYVQATGGKEKLDSIKSYQQTGKMTIQGIALDMKLLMQDNDKMNLDVTMGTNSMMKQIINGNEGVQIQEGQKKRMKNKELIINKINMNLLSCLSLADYGLTANLKEIIDFNNESCYVIELYKSNEIYSTDYYSVNTGLKMGSKGEFETSNGIVSIVSVYSNHRDFDGIILPATSEQIMENQSVLFSIDKMEINVLFSEDRFILE